MNPLDMLALTALPSYTESMELPIDCPTFPLDCMDMILASERGAELYRNVHPMACAMATWAGTYQDDDDYRSVGFRL